MKGSDILNKLIGTGLLIASMAFFVEMGHVDEFVLPGLLFGASGLWLTLRRGRPSVERDPGLERRIAELAEGLAATQIELTSVEQRLERVTEEQEFMGQLAGRSPTTRGAGPAPRPLEMPGSPGAPEIAPPR